MELSQWMHHREKEINILKKTIFDGRTIYTLSYLQIYKIIHILTINLYIIVINKHDCICLHIEGRWDNNACAIID